MPECCSERDAARVLGLTRGQARRVLATASVRRLVLPGIAPKWVRADVEKLARSAIVGEGPAEEATA